MTLEEQAKNYAKIPLYRDIDTEERYFNDAVREYDSFIAGANSKYVQKLVIEKQIEVMTNLDTNLQTKIQTYSLMAQQVDSVASDHFQSKITGVGIAKEEIRRDLIILKEQLKKLQ